MTDNWDSYLCEVEDKPASILVDLALVEHAPLAGYPCMGYVLIDLKRPDDNGFPRREEYEALSALEDLLVSTLAQNGKAVLAGRCVTNGRIDLIFYTTGMKGWDERVASAFLNFPSYAWETGIHEEPEWETYFEFLYPSEPDLLCIRNRRVCRQLEEQGDDLSQDRCIEHWLDFSTPEGRAAFCEEALALGFMAEKLDEAGEPPFTAETAGTKPGGGSETDGTEALFRVRLSRNDSPENIDDITLSLAELAERFEGDYQGWGTPTAC